MTIIYVASSASRIHWFSRRKFCSPQTQSGHSAALVSSCHSTRLRTSHGLEQWQSRPFRRLLIDGFGTHGTQTTVPVQLLRYAAEEYELLVGNHGSSTLLATPHDLVYVHTSLRVVSMSSSTGFSGRTEPGVREPLRREFLSLPSSMLHSCTGNLSVLTVPRCHLPLGMPRRSFLCH